MERLTKRTDKGILVKEDYGENALRTLYQCFDAEPNTHYTNCEEGYCAIEKLSAYEDLGVTPEQIKEFSSIYLDKCEEVNRLRAELEEYKKFEDSITLNHVLELIKAEEEGKVIKLPCKVGDTVWFVGNDFVNDYEVRRIIVDETGVDCIQVAKEIEGTDYWNSFSMDDIGKNVFMTKPEEQEALERLESE